MARLRVCGKELLTLGCRNDGSYTDEWCHRFDVESNISVEHVPAALGIEQSTQSTLTPGTSVIFEAFSYPSIVGGSAIPLIVTKWEWHDASGTTNPGCGTSTYCVFGPTTSGLMYLEALVNQIPKITSAAVVVVDTTDCGGLTPRPDSTGS